MSGREQKLAAAGSRITRLGLIVAGTFTQRNGLLASPAVGLPQALKPPHVTSCQDRATELF